MDTFKILVKTGNQERAGTNANVWVTLEDNHGVRTTRLKLDLPLHDDLERGTLDVYTQPVPSTFGVVKKVLLVRDSKGRSDDWFCDYIIVQDSRGSKEKTFRKVKTPTAPGIVHTCHRSFPAEVYFPICRWVKANHHYEFVEYGVAVPEDDNQPDLRREELLEKRNYYKYVLNIDGGPAQAAILPRDERFSEHYYWTFAKEKAKLLAKATLDKWTNRKWRSIEELKNLTRKSLGEPKSMANWDSDEWFGLQRLQGLNPYLIKLCNEIPEKFDVTEETVSGLLGSMTLREALEANRIFICDLEVLEGVPCKEGRKLATPLALFFLGEEGDFLPIAIQLFQQKAPDNPVFTPKDHPSTWLVAKMYYNNAEGQHHQGITHLGLTHLLMEGICVCSHRQLSPSHPVFKLMAPHFLFLIAINTRGLEKLISPGGWVDSCMTQGIEGIYEVIRRGFKRHNFYSYGKIAEEVKSRGLLSPEVLPYYPYRDDAIAMYEVIEKYVAKVIRHHYDSEEKLHNDWELRDWRLELSQDKEKGGVGLVGVPGDDVTGFTNINELIDTVTIIISTCSLGHAAANFQQYDQYGFVPNYPGILMKDPPTEKKIYSEEEILTILPNMEVTLNTMVITKLLSSRGTNRLGNFEMQYLYHPADVQAAEEFRKDLQRLSLDIKRRNVDRKLVFDWLDPEIVPNSISI